MDVSREMTLYWNGTDFCADFMEEAAAHIYSIRLIQKEVFIKTKIVQRKDLSRDWAPMVRFASFIMHMIITSVLLGMNLPEKTEKIKLIPSNFHSYQISRISFMWWLDSHLRCSHVCISLNGAKFKRIWKHTGQNSTT